MTQASEKRKELIKSSFESAKLLNGKNFGRVNCRRKIMWYFQEKLCLCFPTTFFSSFLWCGSSFKESEIRKMKAEASSYKTRRNWRRDEIKLIILSFFFRQNVTFRRSTNFKVKVQRAFNYTYYDWTRKLIRNLIRARFHITPNWNLN